ncbi:MAG: C25 family cysteine peptidase, partial [Deltaproteobacteria bacterium]|nr:C25 family cysteine peptidase [Deltaproteobacteria bacterium]
MEWRGDLFTADDAEALANGGGLAFFINMTCLNGFFQAPYGDTLAESLLKAENGGAVAVWASSGMTEPEGQVVMNKALIRLLFNGEGLTIGEAVMRAKAATQDQDIRRTWILFGDPATKLKGDR